VGGAAAKERKGKDEGSVFSNLEAIRTTLEDQLGLDTMLQAYNLVQVSLKSSFPSLSH